MFKKLSKAIFTRLFLMCFLVLLQIVLLWVGAELMSDSYIYVSIALTVLSVFVVIYILNKRDNPNYKIAWVVPIITFPLVGGLFYLILKAQGIFRLRHRRLNVTLRDSAHHLKQDAAVLEKLQAVDPHAAALVKYMSVWGKYPAVQNTRTRYLPSGEIFWKAMLAELEKAERYIFLEFFIIKSGVMWDSILEILKRKAAQGVEVRLLYDGMGSIDKLPANYHKKLNKMGIKCRVFNPFVPFFSAYQNNRDHRKICVVDGRVAFTGGANLADEYVNVTSRFGHWRDSALIMEGKAAYNFAIMFLQMWKLSGGRISHGDYAIYAPTPQDAARFTDDGLVLPYGNYPIDGEPVGEFVYLDIINNAVDYVYITSPYLVLDYNMILALANAAKRGVKVKIIVPEIPDKWYTHSIAVSFFSELIEKGIEIYKYTPGFIHSKTFVSDDKVAVVGTINLDYRSLYLQYECAAWMYGSTAVAEITNDFNTLTSTCCHKVTLEESRKINIFRRLLSMLLRVFAPLL